eukprot:4312819-Prymnesium_polylepis.1
MPKGALLRLFVAVRHTHVLPSSHASSVDCKFSAIAHQSESRALAFLTKAATAASASYFRVAGHRMQYG